MQVLNCVFLVIITSTPLVYAKCTPGSCLATFMYPCSVCKYENLDNVTSVELPGIRVEAFFVNCNVETFSAESLDANAQSHIFLLSIERSLIDFVEAGAFDNYNNVRDIRFKHNNITSLPDDMFKGLKLLTKVDFSSNKIPIIGENVFTAPTIVKLNLANNQITSFCVKQLIHLEDLNLENNRIAVLSELPRSLKTVRFNFNRLTKLANATFYNMSLIILDLSNNNIQTIESGAINKTNVHFVDLSFNNLTEVSYLFNSTSLRRLDLTGNQITRLDGKIVSTAPRFGTCQIILKQNQIATFSAENLNVGARCDVDMSQNSIEKLEKSAVNESIQILDFNLSQNKIKIVPSGFFSKFRATVELNLSRNYIEQLEIGSFLGLSSLTRLDLSFNRLRTVHETVFLNTPYLNKLNLAGNNIRSLNGYELIEATRINVIELEGNKFTCLDLASLIRQFKKGAVRVVYGTNHDISGINGITCENPGELTIKTTTELISAVEIHQILEEIKHEVSIISDKSEAGILALILFFVIVITGVLSYTIFIKSKTSRGRFAITDEEEESIM